MNFGRFLPRLAFWRRSQEPAAPALDDPSLVIVVRAFDDTEAASAVLARSERWTAERPAVLRHHLRLPQESVDQAGELLEQDGWRLRHAPAADESASDGDATAGTVALFAERAQKLDALHCSQESSRMASLAQRLRGRALGWEALQLAEHDGS
ncbi:hypothetical protein [Saccharopolyspora sp.]|uniref:hypothetical protein n=1 Tax=Saccharopolyspora sp. TaxID=33915 RepID=UPI0025FB3B4D|nr:hypothetical protein [Saccharopolyspora sp.]